MKINIRAATQRDSRDIWVWRNHAAIRKWCFNNDKISCARHREWFDKKIAEDSTMIYIAENGKHEKLGQVRFEKGRGPKSRININLNPLFLGKGLGHRIIKRATASFLKKNRDIKEIIAEVIEDNIASHRAFNKAGYLFAGNIGRQGRRVKVFSFNRRRRN